MAGAFTALPDSRASVCSLDWKDWSPLGIQGLFLLLKLMKMAKELKICTTESLEFIYHTIQVSLRYSKWLRSLGQLVQRPGSLATIPLWHLQWLVEGQMENKGVKQKILEAALSFKTSLKGGYPEEQSHLLPLQSWRFCHSVLFWFHGVPATVLPKEPISPSHARLPVAQGTVSIQNNPCKLWA